jgi:hypothetical protein
VQEDNRHPILPSSGCDTTAAGFSRLIVASGPQRIKLTHSTRLDLRVHFRDYRPRLASGCFGAAEHSLGHRVAAALIDEGQR